MSGAEDVINSSRGGHGVGDTVISSQRSENSSANTTREGPPKVYEEIIQALEADVRKHIRIEQQLKLHIESIEYRLDELENENEKLQKASEAIKNEKLESEVKSEK